MFLHVLVSAKQILLAVFVMDVRSSDDKKAWKDENTTNEWKLKNIELLRSRSNGWQQVL